MERFQPFNYVEHDFEQLCLKHGISDFGICNDFVLCAYGDDEFDVSFVRDLLFTINVWNNTSLFADKHIIFKFGLSGICVAESVIKPYLRLWYEVDGVVSYSKNCKL